MKENSKVNRALIIGMALLLIGLPLLAKEAPAKPKPQGTLRVALAGLAEEGFFPDMGDAQQVLMCPVIYEYLFYINEKTRKPMSGLGERFEYSKDGLTFTVYLRKGIQFNDGWGEVTADDVKFSYDRARREGSTNTLSKFLKKAVKDIEVVNPYTVAFHLKATAPDFWWAAVEQFSAYTPIMCKKYIEKVGEDKARFNPVGSGPYRLVEHEFGSYLKFEALDEHWRIVPEFKYLEVYIVPEESTRIAMLKTGKVDIAPVSPLKTAELKKIPGITASLWPGGYFVKAVFGGMTTPADKKYKKGYHRTDPWKDIKVREAMSIAIDRKGIAEAVYKGAARPMPICWALPGMDELKPIPYDPERAKKLLAEAGYPNGFDLTVAASSDWAPAFEMLQVMQVVAANWEAIGIKVKIKPMDKSLVIKMTRARKAVGHVYAWKSSYKDTYAGRFKDKFGPDGNAVWFLSDELTTLIDNYEAELDLDKRAAALNKVRDYWYNEWINLPIVMAYRVFASRDEVVGEWPTSTSDKSLHLIYVRHAKPLNTPRLFTP
jgi:peptide/nickel transport system substrate-binding protein